MAVSLTQNNMSKEIRDFNRKQFTMGGRGGPPPIMRAPAKNDPNSSMRRLSITAGNLNSYNSLFALGGIRREQKDGTINFTSDQETKNSGKMGDFASSTITDLRKLMMDNNFDSLAGNGTSNAGGASNAANNSMNDGSQASQNSSQGQRFLGGDQYRFKMNNTISGANFARRGMRQNI